MDRSKSIELLNRAVAEELQAVHQYMYFHFHLDDQGFGPLADLFRRTAIEEMLHVERIAERILFLKGEVEMAPSGPVEKITDAKDIVASATKAEEEAVVMYNDFGQQCAAAADSASKQLFESLVNDEERHFDQFDTQLENIARFGPNYLALQSFGGGAEEAGPPA